MNPIESFAEASARRARAFDISIILVIIEAIMSLFKSCPKPSADAIRSGQISMLQRAKLFVLLRRHDCPRAAAIANAMADEAIDQQKRTGAGPDGDWCDQMLAAGNANLAESPEL